MTTDRFPLAYSTLGCPGWTLEHAAEQAAQHGYRALELRLLDHEIVPSQPTAEQRRRMKQLKANTGVEILALGLSTRFSAPDPSERQSNVDELYRYLELANDLGVSMVRTFGGNVQPNCTIDQTIDWVAQSLATAMPTAERQGVTVLLETHDAFCRGAEVERVLAQVSHANLSAVWDVHHPFRMGESIEETWRLIGARTKHVHLKDARLKPDGSWQLVLMGEGEVPCRQVVELLHREGYQGYISMEWEKKWHPTIEEPEVAMPQHAKVARQWFAALGG
jgi:sugar phosphate isomerase/epimerase